MLTCAHLCQEPTAFHSLKTHNASPEAAIHGSDAHKFVVRALDAFDFS